MKFSHILLTLILVVGAVFSGFYLYERQQKQSELIGYYASTKDTLFECKATSITFDRVDDHYEYKNEWSNTFLYDGKVHDYDLSVNNNICSLVDDGPGYLNAKLDMSFYSPDGTETVRDTLEINIVFYTSKTVLLISTKGDSTAMSHWVEYVNSYGLNLKVIQLDEEEL